MLLTYIEVKCTEVDVGDRVHIKRAHVTPNEKVRKVHNICIMHNNYTIL